MSPEPAAQTVALFDRRPFFEKALQYGVQHGLLSPEKLATMRRDFVANVSHELRTPVTAIRSAAETLELALEQDPEAASRFVEIIDRNAQRLRELVEDVLDLARIEARELRLNPEHLNLGPVFNHIASTFVDAFVRRAEALHAQ